MVFIDLEFNVGACKSQRGTKFVILMLQSQWSLLLGVNKRLRLCISYFSIRNLNSCFPKGCNL
jgi:hypothetical protein